MIALADERGDFIEMECGTVYYAPSPGHGAIPAWLMRALADELDRRNAAYEAQIQSDPCIGSPPSEEPAP